MRRGKKTTALLTAAVLLLSACDGGEDIPYIPPAMRTASTAAVDPSSIRPQDDFYGYVNAAYLLENLPEYGQTTSGSFAEVEKAVRGELEELFGRITRSSDDYPAGSTEQLIRELYRQGMEYTDGSAEMEKVRGIVGEIRAVTDIKELMKLWAELLVTHGITFPGYVIVSASYYKSGENTLYIRQLTDICGCSLEELTKKDTAAMTAKGELTDLLMPFTADKPEAERLATDVVYLLLDLAFATDIGVMHAADPFTTFTFISDEETAALLPNLGETPLKLTYGLDANPYGGCYIQDRGQLMKLNELLTNERLEEWKDLLICMLVSSEASFIYSEASSLATYAPDESISREELTGELINEIMPEKVSKLYSAEYFTPVKEKALRDMCDTLTESYRELIGNAEWLSEEGRAGLLRKLDNITFVLGDSAPEEVDPTDAAVIGEDLPDSVHRLNVMFFEEKKARIGQPVNSSEPRMSSQMVNACYDPSNVVTITAAILHAPFFDENASDAANLGGLGMVVGHEMGHAFDSMCMNYDENGNYNPGWLSEADRKELSERADRLSEYYSEYTVLDVYHVDGKLTNGENYADLGAIECITNAVHSVGELKELFENYARIWAENTLDTDAVEQINLDVHSPAKVRVNAVLSSCDKFYEVYDVQEGDGMYKAPGERVSRW